MHKFERQNALREVISSYRIASQTDLARRLHSRNFDVTQASISRDLDELGIVKAAGIYTIPQKPRGAAAFGLSALDAAGDSLIVAKCDSGPSSRIRRSSPVCWRR